MKNNEVATAYNIKYGTEIKIMLRELGGDPDVYISAREAQLGQPDPLAEMLHYEPANAEGLAEAAYYDILKAIEAAFFGRLDRASACAIIKALALVSSDLLTVADGLTYNNYTAADAWSAAHPDEQRINSRGE